MSLTSTTDKIGPVVISGLPQTIPVSFPFQQGSDLLVLDSGASGTTNDPAKVLTLGSDYTVTGGGYNAANQMQTGSITVVAGGTGSVLVNDQIVIMRGVPLNQTSALTPVGPLTQAIVEQAIDKIATLAQQVNEVAARSLQFENYEFLGGTLNRTNRKGNVLGFDTNGNIAYYVLTGTTVALQSVTGTAGQVLVNGVTTPQTGNITLTLASGSPSIAGTANQVLVNGGSAAITSFPITLTLPQSIGTGSTVQFQKLGIGTAVGVNNDVFVQHSVASATASASVEVGGGLGAPASTDLHPNAFRDSTTYTSTVAADAYASYDVSTVINGTLAYNHYFGFQARHSYQGSNTLGVMAGFATLNMGVGASAHVTKLRGFYVSDTTFSGGAVVDAFDGIYIDQLSGTTGSTVITAINVAGNNTISMAGGQLWISANLAPVVTTSRLDVTFDQGTQQGIAVKNKNVTNTGHLVDFYNSSSVVQGSITQTNSTTTAFNTSSDSRLKENFRDLTGVGSIIDAIAPRVFDWRWGGKDAHGFIAQELRTVYPEAVTVGEDDEQGQMLRPWQVDYSKLVPLLMAEVKSLRSRMTALEAP